MSHEKLANLANEKLFACLGQASLRNCVFYLNKAILVLLQDVATTTNSMSGWLYHTNDLE